MHLLTRQKIEMEQSARRDEGKYKETSNRKNTLCPRSDRDVGCADLSVCFLAGTGGTHTSKRGNGEFNATPKTGIYLFNIPSY